jgi:hypothetical protein
MDQPCYKCGQAVEQGIPFCPHCSAPQIRVVVAEPVAVPVGLANASTSEGAAVLPASQTVPVLALPMHWSHALRPCALAALIASVLMSLGLNPFVAMFSVGFLAVVFYRLRPPGFPVKAVAAAGIGALGGLLLFATLSVIEALYVIISHQGPDLRNELLKRIAQAGSQTSDPQVLSMFEKLKSPGGLEFLMIFGLVVAFFAAIILGGLGGALAGAIYGGRDRK